METNLIKQGLKERRIKIKDIASQLGVSGVAVTLVLHGRSTSARITAAINAALSQPVPDANSKEEKAA